MKPTQNLYFLWHYYRAINLPNYAFSIFLALLAVPVTPKLPYMEAGNSASSLSVILRAFVIAMLTGGFLLSLFLFERRRKNQYYFYHNKGYSKFQLIGFAYGINLLIGFLLLLLFIIFY
ncbi:hypothetical protein [Chitinophaga sp. Cy-1792]|uniref:hypothetical protein n=1 Tax=Chitinophaga sp. Cy-1792 TaxID=2608339 RepID=UPI00142439AA|nr:hypothetical protein [Chitinophaga sp. Cy-1792]NIG53007.1 hypothetical protein [Chitinophaga sp. Cy-1792]